MDIILLNQRVTTVFWLEDLELRGILFPWDLARLKRWTCSLRNSLFRAISHVAGTASPAENLGVQRFRFYKFRLKATADQELQMRRIAGCCRFVFNRALALRDQRRDEGRKLMSSDELALLLVHRNSRAVLGATRSVTISASGGDWFVSLLTERNVARPVACGPAVGIDMGVVRFATLRDGQFYLPLNSF
jgi:Helix-turn-helix domain